MKTKDKYGHEIPFNEVLSKAAIVQLIEHTKLTDFAPPFAHLDAHKALDTVLADILNTEGAKLNAAEEAKNRAIAENLMEEANLKKIEKPPQHQCNDRKTYGDDCSDTERRISLEQLPH